jgi:predicted anti-sigma-YlaC factor YlaD
VQCEDLAEMLTDLLEGDVDDDQEAAALAHLASCKSCEQVLAETRDVIDLAHAHGRATLDPDDRERIFREINARIPDPPN